MSETGSGKSPFSKLSQVGIVVKDMDRAIEFMSSLGMGPFKPRWRPPVAEVQAGGESVPHGERKIMFTYWGDLEVELIQPLSEGPHMDFLRRTGGGIHHFGFFGDDYYGDKLNEVIDGVAEKGAKLLMRGRREDEGGFALFDAEPLGTVIEIATL
jgi:catechol 2,3-dioxygenase-like lactoylglutathione lyase family enzyme